MKGELEEKREKEKKKERSKGGREGECERAVPSDMIEKNKNKKSHNS
jgi:hypothetical protein